MTVYLPPSIITDPAVLRANAYAFMEGELPGWTPSPGSPECVLIDAYSRPAGEQAEVLELNLTAAFRGLGGLFGVSPIAPQPATAKVTLTLVEQTGGYTIPAGSVIVGVRDGNGDLQAFTTTEDLIVPAKALTITGNVEAMVAGAGGNALSGAAELISAGPTIASAVLSASGNGLDEEEDSVYLDRLSESVATMKLGVVRADDAAVIARSIAGVFRATGVDNLKPAAADGGEGAEEANVEKCFTVACTDANGVASSAGVLAAVKAALVLTREPNIKAFAVAPHYTKIDVTTTVFAWPGADLPTVKAEVAEALKRFLSPLYYATDVSGNPERWANNPTLRQSDLFRAVGTVAGVRWCSALTFAKHGEALGTANVTLGSGSAVPALPEAETLTITVEPTT